LIADEKSLRFRHELARVAVEQSLTAPRTKALHARALDALTTLAASPPLARLVHHAVHANDAAAVLRLAPQAAREAAARGARREAAAHCRAALAFSDQLSDADHATLLEDYARHCFELNDLAAAIPAREAAIALFGKLGDFARQSAALAAHAMPLVRALRNAEADAASQRAIAIAETLPVGPELARAYETEAYLRMLNRDCHEAVTWGQKAIALAEQFHDNEILAAAHSSVGAALLFIDYPRACEELLTSMRIAGTLDDGGAGVAEAYVMLGSGSAEVFQFANAAHYLQEGIAFARAHDLDRLCGYMEAWQASLDIYQGRWDEAGKHANALLAREIFGSTNRVAALVTLCRLRIRRGDPGVDELLDEALELAMRSGTLQRIAPVRCLRAERAWLAGDEARVSSEAAAAYQLAGQKQHAWFLGEMAYWLWRVGEIDSAPAGAAEPYVLQIGGRWREAANTWKALGCPYEEGRAMIDGDSDAQHAALEIFERLGARPIADWLRTKMRKDGLRGIPRGPRQATRDNVAGLTAREMQVLLLVAEGCANSQIAERLSRSSRTVDHHLASILAKLDATSRTEAVATARRMGILPQK
jgi:DNA-binding CsgD family transcriptional regulator/tetratricopeptide (TPR) repeat protein